MRKSIGRLAPVAGLFFLAPLVGEFLLGNVSIVEFPALPVLALLYGSGAILIRELTRRSGRGWPTMLTLGLVYGLLEAGLIDQTLFHPPGDASPATPLASTALSFVAGHAIWSIGVPIAMVEAFVPARSTKPWLGKPGLVVTGILYLLGALLVFRYMQRTEHFLASPAQLIGAAAVVVALIGVVLAVKGRPRPAINRPALRPRTVGIAAFTASSLFFLKSDSWPGVAFGLLVLAVMAGLVFRWCRREGWGASHHIALAGGALLTYAWGGFLLTMLLGRTEPIHLIGNAIFACGAIVLLIAAVRKARVRAR